MYRPLPKRKKEKFLNLVRGFDLLIRGPIMKPDRLQHSFVKWMGPVFVLLPLRSRQGKTGKTKKPWNRVNLNGLHYDRMFVSCTPYRYSFTNFLSPSPFHPVSFVTSPRPTGMIPLLVLPPVATQAPSECRIRCRGDG